MLWQSDEDDPEHLFVDFNTTGFTVQNCEVHRVYIASPLTSNNPELEAKRQLTSLVVKEEFAAFVDGGVCFEVYDPADHTHVGSDHSPHEIYEIDHGRVVMADLIVFNMVGPSVGVGIETQIASDATLPRVILAPDGQVQSRMFTGASCPLIAQISYSSPNTLRAALREALPLIAKHIQQSAKNRRRVFHTLAACRFGKMMLKHRIKNRVPIRDLAAATDVTEQWLRHLERCDELLACLTMIQLRRIATALDLRVDMAEDMSIRLRPSVTLSDADERSLDNLCDYLRGQEGWVSDERVFAVWAAEGSGKQRAGSGDSDAVISIEEWGTRFAELDGRLFP